MKTVTVAIADLQANLFVRQALDWDHVAYLAELIENGVKLPPIKITSERVVIDGRHRKEAYELNDFTDIEAEIVEVDNETDLIGMAYKANVGGSLPPSQEDTEHTVMVLVERKETITRIAKLLGLPAGLTRKYVTSVQSKTASANMQRAVSAVTDEGLTVVRAAELHKVDPEKLKERLSGHRRAQRSGVAEAQRSLTHNYRSVGLKNARLIRGLLTEYEDGGVSEKQVREVLAHIDRLQRKSARSVAEWASRFEANVSAVKAVKRTA